MLTVKNLRVIHIRGSLLGNLRHLKKSGLVVSHALFIFHRIEWSVFDYWPHLTVLCLHRHVKV